MAGFIIWKNGCVSGPYSGWGDMEKEVNPCPTCELGECDDCSLPREGEDYFFHFGNSDEAWEMAETWEKEGEGMKKAQPASRA